MIIIGEMNLTLKGKAGEFFCPRCAGQQAYAHKRVRRFLTLYFIPVIPLDTVSEHVQCQKCRQTFPVSALQQHEEDYRRVAVAQFADDVRRVMVLTMLADDRANPEELGVLARVYFQLAQRELTETEIQADIRQARAAKVEAATYAKAIASRRSAEEKDWILRGAFLIAAAQGDLPPARGEQLRKLLTALGVTEDRFRQIVEDASR